MSIGINVHRAERIEAEVEHYQAFSVLKITSKSTGGEITVTHYIHRANAAEMAQGMCDAINRVQHEVDESRAPTKTEEDGA